MKSLFLYAAATAAVLTSAAFATPGPGSDIAHQARGAGGRLTILTDNQTMMCKLSSVRVGYVGTSLSGPAWGRTAVYLDDVGQINCTGRLPVTE